MNESILVRDPITFEVIRGGLDAACEEMKTVMTRAAFSPLLSLSADLSCALLDCEGQVVAQGNDIPVHLGAMPHSAEGILREFPIATWKPGDTVLCNDPYSGGSHLPDMTMLSPAFDGDQVVGFAASRVHWPDIGGSAPGSSAVTDEIIKEGLRLPPVKIMREGEIDSGLYTVLMANVRVPRDRVGDFRAQLACNARGVQRLQDLCARYGAGPVLQSQAATQELSERKLRARLSSLADGHYSAVHHLDGDGYTMDRGDNKFRLEVTVTVDGDHIHFDFSGTGRQVRGPMNAPISVTSSACYYTVLALCEGEVAPNSGAYRPVQITAPCASLVNASYPAPVVAANTEMSNRLVDLLLDALAPALGDDAIAGSYGCAGVWTIGGFDRSLNRSFVHLETIGGGMGASNSGPGIDGHRVHMGNTMNLPVEAVEASFPIRIRDYSLITESAGRGLHRGGMGVRRVIEAMDDHLAYSLLFERALHPALGVAGGEAGRCARFVLEDASGSQTPLDSKTQLGYMSRGDKLIIETAGGGGWGVAQTSEE